MIMFLPMSTGYWIIALSGNRNVYLFFLNDRIAFTDIKSLTLFLQATDILNNHVSFFMTELLLLL
jgi:hypothetical protein